MSQGLKHGFVHTNGIRMHYVEQGEGPLVLLLHGWPESCHSWRHQMPALAAAGYRVVAPDQRGYGHSDAPTEVGSYNILNLTGDLVGLVDALGEKEACLIGHDWGATLTAVAALLRPDLFRLIGLLSVPYRPRRKVRPAARFHLATQEKHFYQDYFQQPGRVERELEEDIRRALLGIYYTASAEGVEKRPDASFVTFDKSMRMVDNLAIPDTLPDWLTEADLDVFVEQFRHSGFHGPTNWYRNLDHNWQITPFLDGAKIGQPTLFLAGERDGVLQMAAEELEALAHNVPNLWRKHLIPGAGHWAQQERPQETNEVLIEFLSAHKPGKPG